MILTQEELFKEETNSECERENQESGKKKQNL